MVPDLQSTSVCVMAALLLQLTCPGHGQYMSGYGTGPFIPGLMGFTGQDSDDPKYDDAKGASTFASFYFAEDNLGRSDRFPKQESPYKYHPPLYPSAALGTLLPQYDYNDYGQLPYYS